MLFVNLLIEDDCKDLNAFIQFFINVMIKLFRVNNKFYSIYYQRQVVYVGTLLFIILSASLPPCLSIVFKTVVTMSRNFLSLNLLFKLASKIWTCTINASPETTARSFNASREFENIC